MAGQTWLGVTLMCAVAILPSLVAGEICTDAVCEYDFVIRRSFTMTYVSEDGKTYKVDGKDPAGLRVLPTEHEASGGPIGSYVEADEVITADGFERSIITVNHQFPAPNIEVMEGSQVVVRVNNQMSIEAITLHWHGMHQYKTPWMDGAAYVSQCPIHPGQTFTYRFRALPAGTHWYHSHLGNQRLDGSFGFLVVHAKMPLLPEFTVSILDWFHQTSNNIELASYWRSDNTTGTGSLTDDADPSKTTYQSGIINGRGRGKLLGGKLPLAHFNVTQGQRFRFRMVNMGAEYSYSMSIDQHEFDVVACDGADIKPIRVSILNINPGETFDIEVDADQEPGSYWMRAVTVFHGALTGQDEEIRAVIAYDGFDPHKDPTSKAKKCTPAQPCAVFNCPVSNYVVSGGRICVGVATAQPLDSMLEKNKVEYGLDTPDDEVLEYFFNFGFMGVGPSINARKFASPSVPVQTQTPGPGDSIPCDDEVCKTGCFCAHVPELPFNKTVQIIMSNNPDFNNPTDDFMSHHPIHLHGHWFAVVHMGFSEFDNDTHAFVTSNDDVTCDYPYCSNPHWKRGRPQSFNLENPPIKDTVIVPGRGYTVIRFRTLNPGYWFMHCHQESHVLAGMGLVFNEAADHPIPPPPGFPTCTNMDWNAERFDQLMEADIDIFKVY